MLTNPTPTTWPEVFEKWIAGEENQPGWLEVAKAKGWETVREWRAAWAAQFKAAEREWTLHTIPQPLEVIPHFLIGPTQGWQNRFPEEERNTHTFATLVERFDYHQNPKVRAIIENFPDDTQFIGIILPNDLIVLFEGHHRAAGCAVAARESRIITAQPTIALTRFTTDDQHLLSAMLLRGSRKEA